MQLSPQIDYRFFKCYPTRYVTIRLHAIARRHDDKTERHFMQSINNIFFKIKFHTQKNLKSTKKKRKVYQIEIIGSCRFTILLLFISHRVLQ